MARTVLVRRVGVPLLFATLLWLSPFDHAPDCRGLQADEKPPATKPARAQRPNAKPVAGVRSLEDKLSAERKLERAIHKKFAKRVTVDLSGTRLAGALNDLAKIGGFDLLFDPAAVAADDIVLPLTLSKAKFHQTSIRLVFDHILGDGDTQLAWEIENGVVKIMTRDKADAIKSRRVYSIEKLLKPKAPAPVSPPQKEIVVLDGVRRDAVAPPRVLVAGVVREITSGIWDDDDPETGGSIDNLGDILAVRQTQAVLYEIDELLNGLKVAARAELKGGAYDVRDAFYDHEAEAAARKALKQTIAIDCSETTLEKAFEDLAKKTGLSIVFDPAAIRIGDIRPDQEVTLKLKSCTVESALSLILEQHADTPLTWLLNEGLVTVLTQDKADNVKRIVVYDIRDLLSHGFDEQMLNAAIQSQSSGIWRDDDPETGGAVEGAADVGALVVRQTDKVHAEVAALLAALRTRIRESERRKGVGGKKPAVTDDTPMTRYYPFLFKDRATAMQAAIIRFVAPKTWSDKNPNAAISIVEGTLIIRHTVKTHREIRVLLEKIDKSERLGASRPDGGAGIP